MAKFKVGELANISRRDGSEITVRITGFGTYEDDYIVIELENDGSAAAGPRLVKEAQLLRSKGPFFELRGLVFTTSTTHPNEEGEIVGIGHGPKSQKFYCVKFSDEFTEWLSENDVIIQEKAY